MHQNQNTKIINFQNLIKIKKKAFHKKTILKIHQNNIIKQIIFYTMIMILVSIAPVLRVTGSFYIYPATAIIIALIGGIMLYYGVQLHKTKSNTEARKLMLASVLYITVVQVIYVVDKFLH